MSDTEKKIAGVAAAHDASRCPALGTIAVAYHEGGHAVISYAAWPQRPVEFATIVPDDDYLGRVRHADQSDDWRKDCEDERMADAMAVESETVMYLAGYGAEVRFLSGIAAVPYHFDWTPDSFGAQHAASETCDGDTDPRHHVYSYWDRTSELLEQSEVWLAISRVAGALLRRRTLSGDGVEAIVEQAGVEADPWQVPLFGEGEDDEDDEAFSWERF